jgi:prefoldin subunit 5
MTTRSRHRSATLVVLLATALSLGSCASDPEDPAGDDGSATTVADELDVRIEDLATRLAALEAARTAQDVIGAQHTDRLEEVGRALDDLDELVQATAEALGDESATRTLADAGAKEERRVLEARVRELTAQIDMLRAEIDALRARVDALGRR